MRLLIYLLLPLLFFGCFTKYPDLKTVEKVNIDKYLGSWYEIARYEHSFEEGCTNVKATYSLNKDNGYINVLNECTKEGKKTVAKGVAYAEDESNSKLKVSFFRPFYGNYWVLMLGDDYEYALIGEPSREYLWILARKSSIDEKLKEKILSELPKLGYTKEKLIWTKQTQKLSK